MERGSTMNINERICQLMIYAREAGLIQAEDDTYTVNRVLEVLELDDFEEADVSAEGIYPDSLEEILKDLVDDAIVRGVLEDDSIVSRDLFDTKIMGCLVARPSEIVKQFNALYKQSPEAATAYYYRFSQDTDYIRRYRIKKDMKWITATDYGDLDITINLS